MACSDIGVSEALRAATGRLAAAGIARPAAEARLLVGHVTGLDAAALIRDPGRAVDGARLERLLERRTAREPMAHLVGQAGFWTLTLAVDATTLIPRPDSETLIEAALATLPDREAVRHVLDFGTGTGCLLLAALSEYTAAFGVGVDRSAAACGLAARNAAATGLGARAAILCGDWAASITGRFDLILCNPPYIETAAIVGLMPEVARFEPRLALDGGGDGLAAYRQVLPTLPGLLSTGGVAILEIGACEIGAGQGPDVRALAGALGYDVAMRRDLAGHERAVILRCPVR